jgi:nucleoside-diphosphate-sugar epimerase
MRILDMTRAKSYGFVPKYSLEEGVKETIKWFKENREIIDKRHNAFR